MRPPQTGLVFPNPTPIIFPGCPVRSLLGVRSTGEKSFQALPHPARQGDSTYYGGDHEMSMSVMAMLQQLA
jgi:hypothetical protein